MQDTDRYRINVFFRFMVTFSQCAQRLRASEIRELMKIAADPDIISFAGGMPNPSLFPTEEFAQLYARLDTGKQQDAFQYGPTPGYPPLLESLRQRLESKGISCSGRSLVITQGGQQAIDILSRVLIDPGRDVITETPAFIGALASFNAHGARFKPIPLDDEGIDPSCLERELDASSDAVVYCNPCFQNPTGVLYSSERKDTLASLLCDHSCCCIEDDPYNELWFEKKDIPATRTMIQRAGAEQPICYVGSFSKLVGPGLRLGFILGPDKIVEKCILAKQSMDACSSSFTQVLLHEFMHNGMLDRYIDSLRKAYSSRAELMNHALTTYMPPDVSWTVPRGGFYVWLTLPEHVDATDIFERAVARRCAFVIGRAFDPLNARNNSLRLSYSHTEAEQIDTGIRILSEAIHDVV